jgi:hypothetical protein
MDEFLRLNNGDSRNRNTKITTSDRIRINSERIEKLKKTFEPFWMREMRLHQIENRENSNPHNTLNQI